MSSVDGSEGVRRSLDPRPRAFESQKPIRQSRPPRRQVGRARTRDPPYLISTSHQLQSRYPMLTNRLFSNTSSRVCLKFTSILSCLLLQSRGENRPPIGIPDASRLISLPRIPRVLAKLRRRLGWLGVHWGAFRSNLKQA